MKLGKDIHEIFLFYTPQLMDIYFTYLKNKIQKTVGVSTLLVKGSDLPCLHSESHIMDAKLFKVYPHVREDFSLKVIGDDGVSTGNNGSINLIADEATTSENINNVHGIDLVKQNNIKKFSKNGKTKQTNKSCIINKKAS